MKQPQHFNAWKKAVFLLAAAPAMGIYAQDYVQTEKGVCAQADGIHVELQCFSPSIVRVVKYPEGEKVVPHSYSVVMTPAPTPFTVQKGQQEVTLTTDSVAVRLDLRTGRVTCADRNGHLLLSEKHEGTQFTPATYGDTRTYQVRQAFRLDKDEAIYGLGQHQHGKMNQRNQVLTLRQNNTEIAIPYWQSVKGYGVLWDNTSPTTFTDNPIETAFESQAGRCTDYYLLYGGTADRVMQHLRRLTGQAPMNALWTYGYWQSKERYQSQEELLEVVKKYRDLQVPLDCIVQDWQYWGVDASDWNAVEFNNPNFPSPTEMIEEVHRQKAHIAISVWPNFGKHTTLHRTLKEKGLLLDFKTYPEQANVYDPFHPEARELYWQRMNQHLFALGIDGWWLDATEPEFSDKDDRLNQPTHDGVYRSVYNAFPIVSVGGVYDHQRSVTSDKRVHILTRSAFAGQQRYAACSWSGDIHATWEVMRKQIPAGLNFSVCGIPYWNTDIGGFITWESYREGVNDPAYHELYVRWLQFGAFTPLMRSHGTNTPREIYRFGERGSWEFDTIEQYIRLRYRLLPYIYSTSWKVTSEGETFLRPLFMDYPEDRTACELDDQYLFGRSLLVAPVTEPMHANAKTPIDRNSRQLRKVYLPKGSEWFDFWTGERLAGGRYIDRTVTIDVMPLYVRAGSILPMAQPVQYAEEKDWDTLEIRIYPGQDGQFTLYEDEKDNYRYEQGARSVIPFSWDDQRQVLTIGRREGSFPGMLKNRKFRIVKAGRSKGTGDTWTPDADKVVTYHGKEMKIHLISY